MVPAGGHAADVNPGVEVMLLHADAVAQNGAAGEGAGGVHGDNADGLALLAGVRRQPVSEGALAGARRPGDADAVGAPKRGGDALHDVRDGGALSFHRRDEPCQCPLIPGEHFFHQFHGHARPQTGLLTCRAALRPLRRVFANVVDNIGDGRAGAKQGLNATGLQGRDVVFRDRAAANHQNVPGALPSE